MADQTVLNPTLEKIEKLGDPFKNSEVQFTRNPDTEAAAFFNELALNHELNFRFTVSSWGEWTGIEDLIWLGEIPNAQFVDILNNHRVRTVRLDVLEQLENLVAFAASTFGKEQMDCAPLLNTKESLQYLSLDVAFKKTNLLELLPQLTNLRCLFVQSPDAEAMKSLEQLKYLRVTGKLRNPGLLGASLRHLQVFDGEIPSLAPKTWANIEILELLGKVKENPRVDWAYCTNLKRIVVHSPSIKAVDWIASIPNLSCLILRDWGGGKGSLDRLDNLVSLKEFSVSLKRNAKVSTEELFEESEGIIGLLEPSHHPYHLSLGWIANRIPRCWENAQLALTDAIGR